MQRGTLRRFLSLFLCITMMLVLLPVSVLAAETDGVTPLDEAAVDADGLAIEATNSVGSLLTNTIETNQEALSEECYVTEIQVSGTTALVSYQTTCDADVVVAVYDETTLQMLGSGVAAVTSDASTVSVSIDMDELPEYYVVSAYLLQADTHQPLCEHFVSRYYTTEFQELLSSTAEDYDSSRVLLLDGETTDTNFLVFSEDTLLVEENAETNVITDNGDGTYTITNADESFQALQPGDSFSYSYADDTVLIVVVAAVKVDGTTVTVTAKSDAELSDVFDYVKIEADSYQGESYVDTSEADEGVTYEGPGVAAYALDVDTSFSTSEVFSVGREISDNVTLRGLINFSATASIKAYVSLSWQYVSFKLEYGVAGEIELGGKWTDELAMGKITFIPIPCVEISFKVSLVLEASASITWGLEYKGSVGFTYDSDTGFSSLCKAPESSSYVEVEGKIFFGLKLELALSLISEKLAKVAASAQMGLEASASQKWESNTSKQHDCELCLAGKVSRVLSFKTSLKLLDGIVSVEKTLASFKSKLFDFYYSITYNEFGFTTCPHIRYQVEVTALKEDGSPLARASILGTGLDEAPVTDEDGKAVFYLANGKYTLSVNTGEYQAEKSITVHDGSKKLTMELTSAAVVASGACGEDVYWKLYENGVLRIYGNGDMYDYGDCNSGSTHNNPWYCGGMSVESIQIDDGVTSIGSGAFGSLGNLTNVSIPDSVTKIGDHAFCQCTKLASVTAGSGVTSIGEFAFSYCKSIVSVSIPDSVTSIGWRAFYYCSSLTSITIPDSVTSIGNQSFCGCSCLTSVTIGSGVTSIGDYAFGACTSLTSVTIGSGVTTIGSYAFGHCSSLTSITFPDSVTSIGNHAFYYCSSLTSITIPDSVTSIGNCVFQNCRSLTSVTIGSGVTSIGSNAFYECIGLTSVIIGNGATSIGSYAFYYCSSLTSVTIGNGVTSIGSNAFSYCKALTSITIPNSVTSIGCQAFFNCTGLTSVTIPDSVTTIGDASFYECIGLTSVAIPDSVTSVGQWAFYGCSSLTSVTIDSGMTSIGVEAFSGCSSLTSVTIPDSVTSIGEYAFANCYSLTDVYYAGTEAQWEAISIGSSNTPLTSATIHYNSTGPETQALDAAALPVAEAVLPEETTEAETTEDEISEETTAETAEETQTPEPTVMPEEAETQEEPTIELLAAYSAVAEEADGQKLVSFSGLVPGESYTLLVTTASVKGGELTSDVLLYISQGTANEGGGLAFTYVPKTDAEGAVAMAYGASSKSLQDAALSVETKSSASTLLVSYGGETLTEGTDYVLYAQDNDDGSCTVTAVGRDEYAGTATAQLYGVFFDANGGSGAPAGQAQIMGTALTLSSTTPTRIGYTFLGWATSSAATTTAYSAGSSYTINSSVTLYAVWEKAYILGDVNEDGEVTIADAVRVARYDAGYVDLTDAQLAAADVNGDGEVTIADAVRIARYDAGYIKEL